ncbi:cytochrome P450 [Phaeosphaeriaceae sp. PMI808]|nr:cytochrome P450 [Phaeosphaeriaceae sp. PMI808]
MQGVDKLLSQLHHTLDNHPLNWTLYQRIFGASGFEELQEKLKCAKKELSSAVECSFLSENGASAGIISANIPGKVETLVSLAKTKEDLRLWERASNIKLVQPDTVQADLATLMRDSGACIAIPLLYDLWQFDHNNFPLLLMGVPTWMPLKHFKEGLSARSRLIQEMEALYRRIDQHQTGLLSALRKEVSPYIEVAENKITTFSYETIFNESPLLKSTLYETFRKVQAGTWISVSHRAVQDDATIFHTPDVFKPDRFIEVDQVTGRRVARYGRFKPWGAGVGMCKGRTFAEKEILCVGAALISLWDINPTDGGTWKIPEMSPGAGVWRPLQDIRVSIEKK